MKCMNNHYGQSSFFGKRVRFVVEPDETGGNDPTAGGSSGGSEGEDDKEPDGANDLSAEEMKLQLAKLQADLERQKHANDKLAKNNKELTDKARKYMTDEQKAQADKEARDQELEELKREVRISKYSKRLVGIGMTEADADELAGVIPEMEDSDVFFDSIGKFVEGIKKAAAESAVQKLLKDRPDINAGSGDSGKSIAEDKALAIAKRRNAARSAESKVTDYYKI